MTTLFTYYIAIAILNAIYEGYQAFRVYQYFTADVTISAARGFLLMPVLLPLTVYLWIGYLYHKIFK